MAGLNDVIRSAFPDGNVAKPSLSVHCWLRALYSEAEQDRPPARARNRQRIRVMRVECLADWADC
jgi:hypothetical protein